MPLFEVIIVHLWPRVCDDAASLKHVRCSAMKETGKMNLHFLVTGAAAGVQGATRKILTGILLKRGVHVRVFVRKGDDRAAALRASGAEVS
jgi:hypothetical protein